jgi:type II secretory pathway pseudopilin PulG
MLRREDGFTLFEALITTIVSGILLATMMGTISSTMHWGNDVQERSVLQTEVRASIDRLAADLRQAYTGDATSPISVATPTSLTFTSPDRNAAMRLRRISVRLQSGALQRSSVDSTNVGSPPWTFPATAPAWIQLVGSVVGTTLFTYADATGAATTDPAAVRSVGIAVTIATRDTPSRRFIYRTSVTIRASR